MEGCSGAKLLSVTTTSTTSPTSPMSVPRLAGVSTRMRWSLSADLALAVTR